jgi:hypothetical protein
MGRKPQNQKGFKMTKKQELLTVLKSQPKEKRLLLVNIFGVSDSDWYCNGPKENKVRRKVRDLRTGQVKYQ